MNYQYLFCPWDEEDNVRDDVILLIEPDANGGDAKLIYVPNDESNIDWQKYLKWRSEGNTPLDAVRPEPINP